MTEFDEKVLLGLVERVYDAAVAPSRWSSVIDAIRSAVGAEVAVMFYLDRRPDVITSSYDDMVWSGYDSSILKTYEDYFAAREVRAPPFFAVPCGRVCANDREIPFATIKRSEIYNDFYIPLRADGHCLAMKLFQQENRYGALTVHKAREAGFGERELKLFEALTPHVVRALQVQRQIETVAYRMRAANSAIAATGVGLIAVDGAGRIKFVDTTAERLLRAGDALAVSRGILGTAEPANAAILTALITGALDVLAGKSPNAGKCIRIGRPGRPPLGILACPLPAGDRSPLGLRDLTVLLLLHDPEAALSPSPNALARFFELTAAEAMLLVALCEGDRLADFAERKGVTLATAKTQLRHIFDKLGSHRQADLIRTVAGDPVLQMAANR